MEELCLMIPKSGAKFEEKLTCGLEKDKRNLANLKVSKLVFSWDPFVQRRKYMGYKSI